MENLKWIFSNTAKTEEKKRKGISCFRANILDKTVKIRLHKMFTHSIGCLITDLHCSEKQVQFRDSYLHFQRNTLGKNEIN